MKLVSLNVEFSLHTEAVLRFLKSEQPDVVCLQELLGEEFGVYKSELGFAGVFQPWGYVRSMNYQELRGKRQGVAIFAKEIVDSGAVFYHGAEENALKPFREYISDEELQKNSALVWADVIIGGDSFRVMTTHLPVTEQAQVTAYQLSVIDKLLAQLEAYDEFVLAGDTNAPRGTEGFARLAARYKDNVPLHYTTSLDQELHKVKGLQHMVDGLFTTGAYRASNVELREGVSDHMAITADIFRS